MDAREIKLMVVAGRIRCIRDPRPETGSHQPSDGDPGTFYFGDVGWGAREELNVMTGPGHAGSVSPERQGNEEVEKGEL